MLDKPYVAIIHPKWYARQSLERLLDNNPLFSCVAGFESYARAKSLLAHESSIAVVDVNLKYREEESLLPFAHLKVLRDDFPHNYVFAVSDELDVGLGLMLLDHDIQGYDGLGRGPDAISGGVQNLCRAGMSYPFAVTRQSLIGHATRTNDFLGDLPLDPKKRKMYLLLGKGLSGKEVAEQMNLSRKTVEAHRRQLAEHLAISVPELVSKAKETVASYNKRI